MLKDALISDHGQLPNGLVSNLHRALTMFSDIAFRVPRRPLIPASQMTCGYLLMMFGEALAFNYHILLDSIELVGNLFACGQRLSLLHSPMGFGSDAILTVTLSGPPFNLSCSSSLSNVRCLLLCPLF